jgi:hypothetical protein
MKYLESRKFSRYDSSKNVSAFWTGFDILWDSLTVDSRIDGLEKTGCRIEVHAIGVPQSSSERGKNSFSLDIQEHDFASVQIGIVQNR